MKQTRLALERMTTSFLSSGHLKGGADDPTLERPLSVTRGVERERRSGSRSRSRSRSGVGVGVGVGVGAGVGVGVGEGVGESKRAREREQRELKVPAKLVVNELRGCLVKLVKRVDGLPHKIVEKIDVGKIEEELVRNELMDCTMNGWSERRITAPWCGSRVAGWRVAVGKTTVLMAVITSLASEASLVSPVEKWNVMVPRREMTMILRKRAANVTSITAVLALTALLMQLALRASMASEDCVASMAPMVLASVALAASMVWVTALKRRELSNEMLRYPPLETWLCSTTILAEEDDGSRCSRRVDDAKVKKELMGCQSWALVVTMAVATMASMVWMAQGCTDVEVPWCQ